MKSFVRLISVFIVVIVCANILSCSGAYPLDLYDGGFLEKKLILPYNIEGTLTQNGERYDVRIESSAGIGESGRLESGEFRIKFLSGDVTEGLTVEFFENGVFLFFDDLRFKTNSAMFTNLETLKSAFEILAAPYTEKYVVDTAPVDGIDILEIGAKTESGDIKAYVNKSDGSIIRLTGNLNGANIILDIKKFENTIDIKRNGEQAGEIFDVVDDYIGT